MPFCSSCGSPMEGNFCAKCGTRTGSTATAGSPPPAATPIATPPGTGAPAKEKGTAVLDPGGGGIFVLTSIAVIGGGLFVAHKVKQAGIDPELIEKNPGLAAAKMIAAMNPDVDVVSTDENSGTITLRDKKSGETVTMNFEDVEKGRIVFEGKGGEKVEIQGQGEGSSRSLRVDSSEGSMVFGAGAASFQLGWPPIRALRRPVVRPCKVRRARVERQGSRPATPPSRSLRSTSSSSSKPG